MDVKENIRRTPLFRRHVELGARIVPFAGFEMPMQYSGVVNEHLAVRNAAGIFDVSHMGEFFVTGPHAFECVQQIVTNDASRLQDGQAMYTVMCREDGGIIDDLIVYRIAGDEFMLVVNAANRDKDFDWLLQNNAPKAHLEDRSDDIALLAVQGPSAVGIVEEVIGKPLRNVRFYHFEKLPPGSFAGCRLAIVSRTGYTGEPGFEIYCDAGRAIDVWDALLKAGSDEGLVPAGLGARDTLRIEAGYSLYGNDITEETNPLEAGLGWLVKLEKDDFVGKAALERIKERGPERKLVGFAMQERGIPRTGYPILDESDSEIGVVTSGTQSPLLHQGIGLGYVPNDPVYSTPGVRIGVSIRGRPHDAEIVKPPFIAFKT